MFCAYCGKNVDPNAIFCGSCGKRIPHKAAKPASVPVQPQPVVAAIPPQPSPISTQTQPIAPQPVPIPVETQKVPPASVSAPLEVVEIAPQPAPIPVQAPPAAPAQSSAPVPIQAIQPSVSTPLQVQSSMPQPTVQAVQPPVSVSAQIEVAAIAPQSAPIPVQAPPTAPIQTSAPVPIQEIQPSVSTPVQVQSSTPQPSAQTVQPPVSSMTADGESGLPLPQEEMVPTESQQMVQAQETGVTAAGADMMDPIHQGSCAICGRDAADGVEIGVVGGRTEVIGKNKQGNELVQKIPERTLTLMVCPSCRDEKLKKIRNRRPLNILLGLILTPVTIGLFVLGLFLVFSDSSPLWISLGSVKVMPWVLMLVAMIPCLATGYFAIKGFHNGFGGSNNLMTHFFEAKCCNLVLAKLKEISGESNFFTCSLKAADKIPSENKQALLQVRKK